MTNRGNNIYSVEMALRSLAAGVGVDTAFDLVVPGKSFKLKSIFFDVRFREFVTGDLLNWYLNTTQDVQLEIGVFGAIPLFAKIFENFAPVPAFVNHGNAIVMHRPGQIFFDNWFISESMHFNYHSINYDLLLDYYHHLSIVAEIELLP